MSQKPKPMPSFFKVICNHDFTRPMSLPPIISRKHGDVLPENIKLRTSSGKIWNVKLERTDDEKQQYFFTEGWSKFAKDVGLKFGEFLMFRLSGDAIFDVSVFGINECEREISGRNIMVEVSDDDEAELNKGCIPSSNLKSPGARSKVSKTVGGSKSGKSLEEGNPLYFELCLKPYQMSRLTLRRKFVTASGLNDRQTVKVKYVENGDVQEVALDHRSNSTYRYRTDLAYSWRRFSEANLAWGRTYSFEFIPKMNVIHVKVLDI